MEQTIRSLNPLSPTVRIFLDPLHLPSEGLEGVTDDVFTKEVVSFARRWVKQLGSRLNSEKMSDEDLGRLCGAISFVGAAITHGTNGEQICAARSLASGLLHLRLPEKTLRELTDQILTPARASVQR